MQYVGILESHPSTIAVELGAIGSRKTEKETAQKHCQKLVLLEKESKAEALILLPPTRVK